MALKNGEDRRARRSRRLLKESLLEQLRHKPLAEISVRDVTDGADMNRGTFYLHYTGTAELLESVEAELMEELQGLIDQHIQETRAEGTVYPVLEPLLDFVLEKREICELLLHRSDGFMLALQRLIRRNGAPLIEAWFHPRDGERTDYLLSFLTWGVIGLLKEWFDKETRLSREELLEMAQQLADSAGRAVFGSCPAAPHA